jgi:anaerobic magnesium-protoporphyrin IX monomethyl ester cyclase
VKLCLIRPPESIALDSASVNRPSLPLGVAYLAAVAREAGHDVQVIDAVGAAPTTYTPFNRRIRILGLRPEEIVARIDADVGLIGVGSMFSYNWPHLRPLLASIKERFPSVPLVLGGEAPSAMVETCFREAPVDAVAIGEGEETLVELLALASGPGLRERLAEAKGIAWRDGDRIVRNPRRPRIRDVDSLPWPAWDLFDVDAYARHRFENGLRHRDAPAVLPMLATRGCPYQCTFCTSPQMWTTTYITRDPRKVVDEIEHNVRTHGATNFPFQDLTAIIRKDWIVEFCKEIVRRDLDITWQLPTGTRSEAIDDEVAGLLYRSGMLQMGYAPESGSDEMRKLVKKKVQRDRLYASVRAAIRQRIQVQVFFIVGFPRETRRDVLATLKMVAKLAWMGVHDVGMNHYMVLPGTEITEEADPEWIRGLGDDFYLIPLFGHSIRLDDWRKAHPRFSSRELTAYVLAGFALFYSVLFLRHPRKLASLVSGLFAKNDSSRLQAAIKTMLRNRWRSASSARGSSPTSPPDHPSRPRPQIAL